MAGGKKKDNVDKKIVGLIIRRLRKEYPGQRTALEYRTPFQLLVATILSAQCTDARVNQVTRTLFKKYRTPADFARARREELEQGIRSTGFFRNKARNIRAASQKIIKEFGGSMPETMDELITLPGVARKTANVVLSSAFGKAEGIAVDTHVKRLSGRLGLSAEKNPDKIEKDLMELIPQKEWINFTCLLIAHGRRVCVARKPKCPECLLNDLCPSAGSFTR